MNIMTPQLEQTPLVPKRERKDAVNGNGHDRDDESGISIRSASSIETGLSYGALEDEQEKKLDEALRKCNGDPEMESLAVRQSLNLSTHNLLSVDQPVSISPLAPASILKGHKNQQTSSNQVPILRPLLDGKIAPPQKVQRNLIQDCILLVSLAIAGIIIILSFLALGTLVAGPPRQPVGEYVLKDLQEGHDFFNHYSFYSGKDSKGSNGFVNYVSGQVAFDTGIANVTFEPKSESHYSFGMYESNEEPFVYMKTSPTPEGPRNSIRLEGLKRYNRGLFILDLRHIPSGCGTWPAFWMSDEDNWPVNGEIDIVEGINTQSVVKTALHSTKTCTMDDVPLGVRTGVWDTAQGIPIPAEQGGGFDMTLRETTNCFVWDPHQWLNQGCVTVDTQEGTLGEELNEKGGGVFVLEWDPMNRFIKSWAFSPHENMPENLRLSLETAHEIDSMKRVRPDPTIWPLPYAYYPIGKGTDCPSNHFKNFHLIVNLALCGTVSGGLFFRDCPILQEKYGSCENFIAADTPAMEDVYWKIRGIYVYEREWERSWR